VNWCDRDESKFDEQQMEGRRQAIIDHLKSLAVGLGLAMIFLGLFLLFQFMADIASV
jgi:hypothetical protein